MTRPLKVAAHFAVDDENNQQTPEEILASTLTNLPDEKLTGFALRLALTGHTDIPRESDFDFLAEAEAAFAFVPTPPRKKTKVNKPTLITKTGKASTKSPKKATAPTKKVAA